MRHINISITTMKKIAHPTREDILSSIYIKINLNI